MTQVHRNKVTGHQARPKARRWGSVLTAGLGHCRKRHVDSMTLPSPLVYALAMDNYTDDDSRVKNDPTDAREIDSFVVFLYPVNKPKARGN